MHKSKNPAGQGGAQAQDRDAITSIQPTEYRPKDAVSSLSVYSGRELVGFVIEFPTRYHCVGAQGQLIATVKSQKAAIDLLIATRGVQP